VKRKKQQEAVHYCGFERALKNHIAGDLRLVPPFASCFCRGASVVTLTHDKTAADRNGMMNHACILVAAGLMNDLPDSADLDRSLPGIQQVTPRLLLCFADAARSNDQ